MYPNSVDLENDVNPQQVRFCERMRFDLGWPPIDGKQNGKDLHDETLKANETRGIHPFLPRRENQLGSRRLMQWSLSSPAFCV